MLLLSLKPGRSPSSTSELDKAYSILAASSMVCYITGIFALHWKRTKCQAVFLFFMTAIIAANIILAMIYQQKENVRYLSVAVFLFALNSVLFVKAILVYKKMKSTHIFFLVTAILTTSIVLENFAYSTMEE